MYRILVGAPSSGLVHDCSTAATYLSSRRHSTHRLPSHTLGLNINALWYQALNACMAGEFTHFAMVHSDIEILENEESTRWADRLIEEMDAHDLDVAAVPVAIKDERGLTSSGIGNPESRWVPFRRFTTAELDKLPTTFTAEDIGYGDKFLLLNEAVMIWDMRKPLWYIPNEQGLCRFHFNVEERIRFTGNPAQPWVRDQETEDWMFSRNLWEAGARSGLSTRVTACHHGGMVWPNKGDWGTFKNGDENTASQWEATAPEWKFSSPA